MKCAACKHEAPVNYEGFKKLIPKGTSFVYDKGDVYHSNVEEVEIYVCPKCGTLKIPV